MSVEAIIANANTRTNDAVLEAENFIAQLNDVATDESLGLRGTWALSAWLSGITDNSALADPETVSKAAPTLRSISLDMQSAPDVPSSDQPDVWTDGNVPEFTDQPLPIAYPDQPDTPMPTAPEDPSVRDINVAPWETYEMPDAPARSETALPSVPTFDIDAMDLSVPDIDMEPPSNSFEYVETDYSSSLKTAINNLLLSDVEDGGYGINPDDEQALWDRAKDRQNRLNEDAIDKVRRGVAARGFPLPPGSLYAMEQAVLMEGHAALAEVNREIMLKRSDLYVQARQFAVQQGISLEEAMLRYVAGKYERALNAARASAEFAIQFHNVGVDLLKLRVDVRRLYRDLHAEQLQTVQARLDAFRGELALLEAEERRNDGRLQFYKALQDGVTASYEALRLRDQHTQVEAEIERLMLEASKLRVDVYTAKVRARKDEFDAYVAAVDGERAKVALYESQVKAYAARIDGIVKEAQMKKARFDAELALKTEERERIAMEIRIYEAKAKEALAAANVDHTYNQERVAIWQEQVRTDQFNVTTQMKRDFDHVSKYLDSIRVNNEHMVGSLRAVTGFKELKATAAKAGVQLYETMIAGAESALSAVASIAEG